MDNPSVRRNEAELAVIRSIAGTPDDGPVLMINLNRYSSGAGFPGGGLYREYMTGLEAFLPVVGGKILWRHPVLGQAVGEQLIHEVLGAWYPSHQAFLDLPQANGANENYALRRAAVEYAVIHRCAGTTYPFCPQEEEAESSS